MTVEAEVHQQAHFYGHALIDVRTEEAEMEIERSKAVRGLIEGAFHRVVGGGNVDRRM